MLMPAIGILAILSFLRGAWHNSLSWPVAFLLCAYVLLSVSVIYCICRFAHYVQIAESIIGQLAIEEPYGNYLKVDENNPTVRDLYYQFHQVALELLPWLGGKINKIRDYIHNSLAKSGNIPNLGPYKVSFGFWRFIMIITVIFLSMMLLAALMI